jgi:hypothetical protein
LTEIVLKILDIANTHCDHFDEGFDVSQRPQKYLYEVRKAMLTDSYNSIGGRSEGVYV